MSLKTENEARLEALRASLKRIAKEKEHKCKRPLSFALLICKEEDIRLQIFEAELIAKRYEDEMCGTCNGSMSIEAPRGNHSATPERVPCPDCFPEGVTATR